MTEKEQQQIFGDWLSQHKAVIFKIVRAYTFTVMEQDDLFQEIIIQVWHSVPKFRGEASVVTWLYRIALNTAIKWTKKERKSEGRVIYGNSTKIWPRDSSTSFLV